MHQIGLPGRFIVMRFIINIPTYYIRNIIKNMFLQYFIDIFFIKNDNLYKTNIFLIYGI